MSDRQVLNVEFGVDVVAITYLTVPDDLRETGLHLTHRLLIPLDTNEYDDELRDAYEGVKALLEDALEDVANLPPYDPTQQPGGEQEDEDDDD